jgi:16S rRNA (uracil1498-N3)-methyltransferase
VNARFYAPAARASGDEVTLPEEEARHLSRVLRLTTGDAEQEFDGRGQEFDATVAGVGPNSVTVRLGERRMSAVEPRVAITLAQAVLKGDKMDHVVRDAVMIGAAAIQPIVTARSEIGLASLARGNRRERWQRIAVAAAKQCGRAVVPPVFEAMEAAALFASVPRTPDEPTLVLAEPSAGAAMPLTALEPSPPPAVTIVVGPEGGWTADELDRTEGCRFVRIGPRTLRADAMALVAIAALFTHWREY